MNITKNVYLNINKYILGLAIVVYLTGISFTKMVHPGLFFVFAAAFFCLFQQRYFIGRLKLAAHVWLIPLLITFITFPLIIEQAAAGAEQMSSTATWIVLVTMLLAAVPFALLMTGKNEEQPSKKQRLRIVSVRIVVQIMFYVIWLAVSAYGYIKYAHLEDGRPDLMFWGLFHVFSVALMPYLFGRVLCSWMCPNATMQDALFKNMDHKRLPLPKAVEEQSHATAMTIAGRVDKAAPYLPFTLLLIWFIGFNIETIWDFTPKIWWPFICYMVILMAVSVVFPWRKICTHFCWLSGYRCLSSQDSMWRIRYNRSKCKQCKNCQAEKACPFYIDIRSQDNEMPATCCLCFSCMDACPFDGVITFKRDPEDRKRINAELEKKTA